MVVAKLTPSGLLSSTAHRTSLRPSSNLCKHCRSADKTVLTVSMVNSGDQSLVFELDVPGKDPEVLIVELIELLVVSSQPDHL